MLVRRLFSLSLHTPVHQTIRSTSAFKYYQILNEPQPDDIKTVPGGIPVVKKPLPKLTDVVESRDAGEWRAVERLLSSEVVPQPPQHSVYPTPSGWTPPKPLPADAAYHVGRTRFHNFPIYFKRMNGGNRIFTIIRKVNGNIWALDEELKVYITERTGKKTYTKVDEVCCKLWVRGSHLEHISQFLIDKGF